MKEPVKVNRISNVSQLVVSITKASMLIFLCIICSSLSLHPQDRGMKFKHLSLEEGLSQSVVYCILQDSRGFMWFGTGDGLNRFDGYDFRVFRNNIENPRSISNNHILTIYEDNSGIIWIGTKGGGLNQFDRYTEEFTYFKNEPDNPNSLSGNIVRSIFEDQSGSIWIGTDGGLNKLEKRTENIFNVGEEEFIRYKHIPEDANSISDNFVTSIVEDRSGMLWVGTKNGGLNRFDKSTEKFTRYKNQPGNQNSLSNNSIYSIYEDSLGLLWIGTVGGGMNKFDSKNETFTRYINLEGVEKSLSNNTVYSIYEDNSGMLWIGTEDGLNKFDKKSEEFKVFKNVPNIQSSLNNDIIFSIYEDLSRVLWIGTDGGGINKHEKEKDNFMLYKNDPNDPNSLSNNFVMSICEDRQGFLWIGTEGGLDKFDRKENRYIHYKHSGNELNSLSNNVVSCVYEDRSGILWIGTKGGGLNKFESRSNVFVHYKNNPDDPNSLSNNIINTLYEDKSGFLWVGTNGGLNKLDRKNESFKRFLNKPDDIQSISCDIINVVYEDRSGILWIGTERGLNGLGKKENVFQRYKSEPDKPESLSNNTVLSLFEDHNGILWIGTKDGGLNRFNREEESFQSFSESDGLPNNSVFGILEDDERNLWLSTDKGLVKFVPASGKKDAHSSFTLYNISDGLQSNKFNRGAYFKSETCEMFFGGVNGFNSFFPSKIKINQYIPPVVITDLKIFYKSVPIGGNIVEDVVEGVTEGVEGVEGVQKVLSRSPLTESITETKEIKLPHKNNVFTFEFAALNYTIPEKNQYMYKLDGFDKDWIYAGTRRSVTYTNLDPDDYIFHVRGSNNDGVWNEAGTSLEIKIKPPWYYTWWAYSLYVVLIIMIIFGYTRYQTKKTERERVINERLRRVDKMKDEFLANTSHELRTPLNGIIGIAESLHDGVAGELSEKMKSNLSMIISSGKRLTNLVDSVLDFSKLKVRDLELQIKPVDINSITEIVLKISEPLIAGKEIVLRNEIKKDIPPVNGDENRLLQIMHNLVGNAIKFTNAGYVSVSAKVVDKMVEVSVSDTGIGIPKEKTEDIFKSFEQLDTTAERKYGGTGLGLAITKQLVELQGGSIRVESKTGKGSTFTFNIPCSKGKVESKTKKNEVSKVRQIEKVERVIEIEDKLKESGEYEILIVDDDPINQQVLANHLSFDNYNITSAFNGEEALREIEGQKQFDLILLDIMMPRMSGYEVCKRIREKYLPSELPVILITAKNQVSDLVEGFTHGANDYLAKPFSKNEFLARIKTHLNLLKIHSSYERFIPREFLQTLGHETILDVKLGDQVQKEVTIFFSDIRSYTTLSESMSPKENFDFLNAYLSRVGPIIKKNGGFVNQYYGDGIMALFLGKAEKAITASIEIQQEVLKYNESRIGKGRKPISIGIGLHTGSLMLGIIGDELRLDTGVVSDSVNTASRMEGLSKFYSASIIISEMTLLNIKDPDEYNYRFLGKVQVKGKKDVISVYEIYDGETEEIKNLKIETKSDFEQGLDLYFRKSFADAAVFFKSVTDKNPEDRAANLYLEHCAYYMVKGVPDDWTGIESIESK